MHFTQKVWWREWEGKISWQSNFYQYHGFLSVDISASLCWSLHWEAPCLDCRHQWSFWSWEGCEINFESKGEKCILNLSSTLEGGVLYTACRVLPNVSLIKAECCTSVGIGKKNKSLLHLCGTWLSCFSTECVRGLPEKKCAWVNLYRNVNLIWKLYSNLNFLCIQWGVSLLALRALQAAQIHAQLLWLIL